MAAQSPTQQVPASLGNGTRCFRQGGLGIFLACQAPWRPGTFPGGSERGPCVPSPTSAPYCSGPGPREQGGRCAPRTLASWTPASRTPACHELAEGAGGQALNEAPEAMGARRVRSNLSQ